MRTSDLIKRAILTEKTYKQMDKGLYTFLVEAKADKAAIAKAVAQQFAVSVEKVNTERIAPKTKRIAKTRKMVKVGGGKKATVWVKKGQSIASLLPKAKETKTKTKKEKEVEKVSAEGKED